MMEMDGEDADHWGFFSRLWKREGRGEREKEERVGKGERKGRK